MNVLSWQVLCMVWCYPRSKLRAGMGQTQAGSLGAHWVKFSELGVLVQRQPQGAHSTVCQESVVGAHGVVSEFDQAYRPDCTLAPCKGRMRVFCLAPRLML
jgi:hypothetical protein